jgi:signal transduction histidine kinase
LESDPNSARPFRSAPLIRAHSTLRQLAIIAAPIVAATVLLSWLSWQAFAGQRLLGESLVRSRVTEIARRYAGRIGDDMYVAMTALFRPLRAGRFATRSDDGVTFEQVRAVAADVERCRCATVLRPEYAFVSNGTPGGTRIIGDDAIAGDAAWIATAVAARMRQLFGGWDVALIPTLEPRKGHLLFIAPLRRDASDTSIAVMGLAVDPRYLARASLRPLLDEIAKDSAHRAVRFGVRVRDTGGRVLFATDEPLPSATTARVELGVIWRGLTVEMAMLGAPRDFEALVGLPRSPLPMLVALLAVAVALIVVACVLLWRMIDVARVRADFTSSVSHELRTPLTQIQLFADTMRMGRHESPAEQQRALEIIARESQRLIQLVENVLRFSRAERQVDSLALRSHRLAPIVDSAVESFRLLADARHVGLKMELDQTVVAAVDPNAVRQIVLNLLDNAVRYGPDEQTVTIAVSRAGDWSRLTVSDEGPGVPASERDRIWEPFVRGANATAHTSSTGCGIGLSIVRDLVGQMRGRYGIEDSARGAIVFVELPIRD